MRCPFCNKGDSRVVDSRTIDENTTIRRRRECPECGKRFTTYEKYEEAPLIVHKKDGSRELFDPMKLMRGLLKACEKRPVSADRIKNIVDSIERDLRIAYGNEAKSTQIGELVMKYLAKADQIAYVRFVSVYKQFSDTKSFMAELERLMYDE